MKTLPDGALFKLVQQDNERAFSILFDRYKVKLYRHIYKRTGSGDESEEILQNIFISIWKNRNTILIDNDLQPYLMGAARKSVLAFYVSSAKNIRRGHLLAGIEEPMEYPAEDHLIAGEVAAMLDTTVSKMPDTMKKVFELSRKENLSVKQIAATLGLSEQTVKNNITLALRRLRTQLNAQQIISVLPLVFFLN